jgi:hypothetical protein
VSGAVAQATTTRVARMRWQRRTYIKRRAPTFSSRSLGCSPPGRKPVTSFVYARNLDAKVVSGEIMKSILASAALLFLGACATVSTTSVGGASPHGRGVPYYLPKVLFHIELAAFADQHNVSIKIEPRYVADGDAGALSLGYGGSVFTADTAALIPNDQGLLTSVSLQSDSRAAEAFASLGTLAGSLQNGEVGSLSFTEDTVDPTNATDMRAVSLALSRALRDWGYRAVAENTDGTRQRFYATVAQSWIGLRWVWDSTAAASAGANTADCGRGVCVRTARPGRLQVWRCGVLPSATPQRSRRGAARSPSALQEPAAPTDPCSDSDGVLVGSYAISIPNAGPSVIIPVDGGVFADTTHTIALRNGMVSEYRTTRASELEGFGTSAVGFVTAQARAAASGLENETARIRAQTQLTTARTDLVRAQEGLDAVRRGENSSGDKSSSNGNGEQPVPATNNSSNTPTRTTQGPTDQPPSNGQPEGAPAPGQDHAGDHSPTTAPETPPVTAPQSSTGPSQPNAATNADAQDNVWVGHLFGPITAASGQNAP